MINTKDKLSKRNTLIFIVAILIFALSFLFIYLIGSKPEGFLGFLAPITMLVGIVGIVYALVSKQV